MPSQRNNHLDQQKIEIRKNTEKRLAQLLESGDEEAYVALIKKANPNVTPDLLVNLIEQFRERRRQRLLR